jgi:hypothetical protein
MMKVLSKIEILACARKGFCMALCISTLAGPMLAGDPPADPPASTTAATTEIEQLKKMLLDQQRQIDELRHQIAQQGAKPNNVTPETATPENAKPATAVAAAPAPGSPAPNSTSTGSPFDRSGLGQVASLAPILPPIPNAAPPASMPNFGPLPTSSSSAAAPLPSPQADESSPLQLKIGDAYITPVGFMDMTSVSRSTNTGSGIGTNFGSIPYINTQAGSLTETRFSPQNSRIGARIDATVKDMKVMGYWESDFLGQLGSPPNGGLAVTSNPYVFRMRLYWVDVTKGKFEFLAGQSWSLMTPNRTGLSPLPGDIFYSQDMDVNYQLGLVWERVPGFRFVYHPSEKVAFGIALENSEPYVGGANGGSGATLPSLISTTATTGSTQGSVLGGQINNGSSVISSAALAPDIIAKLAFDPTSRFHFEIAGVEIANKIAYPIGTAPYPTFSKVGGGGSVNLSYKVTKNFTLLTNNFYSSGGGRYIFGQAPDFIIRSNGNLSLVHSASTVTGFEATAGRTLYYGYYGGVYIGQNLALDTTGKLIGYGAISSDGQNRAIQEITFGTNTTLAKSPKWGALNLLFQYSYLQRNPWLVAAGAPSNASLSMGFVDFRYTLPGSAPTMGK